LNKLYASANPSLQAYYNGADINFRDQNPTAAIGGYAPYDIYDTDELSRILKQGSW